MFLWVPFTPPRPVNTQTTQKQSVLLSGPQLSPAGFKRIAHRLTNISHTGLKLRPLRPFVPIVVRNFSRYWRNKMVDWLPFPALREVREISYILHQFAWRIIQEKKAEMDRNGDSKKNIMDLMRKHWSHPIAQFIPTH